MCIRDRDYTTIVASTASELAPLQYIAPYAGCAIGEEWMERGAVSYTHLKMLSLVTQIGITMLTSVFLCMAIGMWIRCV